LSNSLEKRLHEQRKGYQNGIFFFVPLPVPRKGGSQAKNPAFAGFLS
jgi:hypothetical protein